MPDAKGTVLSIARLVEWMRRQNVPAASLASPDTVGVPRGF